MARRSVSAALAEVSEGEIEEVMVGFAENEEDGTFWYADCGQLRGNGSTPGKAIFDLHREWTRREREADAP